MKIHTLKTGVPAGSYHVEPTQDLAGIKLTHALKSALALVATRTCDHILAGSESGVSLAELGNL